MDNSYVDNCANSSVCKSYDIKWLLPLLFVMLILLLMVLFVDFICVFVFVLVVKYSKSSLASSWIDSDINDLGCVNGKLNMGLDGLVIVEIWYR